MPNKEANLKGHTKKLLKPTEDINTGEPNFNCRNKTNCPLNLKSVITKTNVIRTATKKVSYIGQTGNSFEERYRNHLSSFRNENYSNNTHLSKYILILKQQTQLMTSIEITENTYKSGKNKFVQKKSKSKGGIW